MEETKIARVVGLASSVLFDPEDPHNPVNRRISIIVMNKRAEAEAAGREVAVTKSQALTPETVDGRELKH
jgi:chemotaxis protein MotB